CNRSLDGKISSRCKSDEICSPENECIQDPGCAFQGEDCDPEKCCEGFCHLRLTFSTKSCHANAFPQEDCSSGIPCESGSDCIDGKCSLRPGDSCERSGSVCPRNGGC
ncbi:hypothetical protein F5H01DRAFT_257414, partial [Linnemannia elongata]